jgi:hypothetical protein
LKHARFILVAVLAVPVPDASAVSPGGAGGDHRPCDFQGHRLMGRVRVVNAFPDFQVKLEKDPHKAELHVQRVEHPAEICGEWQFVDGMADFTIRFVETGEDFKIAFVDKNPGIPEDPVMP